MAPGVPRRRVLALLLAAFAIPIAAGSAHPLRIVNYNILNYPSVNSAGRNPYFRTILAPLGADVVVVQEMQSAAGVVLFRDNVLNANEPGQWESAVFTDGADTDNALFYKPSRIELLGQRNFYVSPDVERFVNEYRVRPVGYGAAAAEIRIYSLHFKASSGSTNEEQRAREATGLRDTLNNLPAGTHVIVTGDFNMYRGTEPAMVKLLEDQADDDGRLYDPLGLESLSWQDNAAMAIHHTQCPSTTAYRPSGSYSGGGMDDRFDLFLPTWTLKDGDGLELLAPTYRVVGNDGAHLNKAVTEAPIAPADTAYARALWWGSDHFPIRVDLSLPAKVAAAGAPIAFGSVIVGAAASHGLGVSNAAAAPADTLEYAYTAPAGFGAPAGTTALLPGAGSTDAITLDTGTAGVKAGNLGLDSNDLDAPSLAIALSGTVLDHAAVSLDSLAVDLEGTLDLGDHAGGGFAAGLARVHNFGWDALQARLAVSAAAITGPNAARFAIAGFAPTLVSGAAASWNVTFDDAGAPADSTYLATLTFTSGDEALPGAAAQPAAVLHLRAHVTSGTVAVESTRPASTRLYAPMPNPLQGGGTVRFDLARAADVALEVFDLSGRRVATLARGWFQAGVHARRWDSRRDDGRPAEAGLYFIRMSGAGLPAQTVRAALVR